jgi:hypothetical protein
VVSEGTHSERGATAIPDWVCFSNLALFSNGTNPIGGNKANPGSAGFGKLALAPVSDFGFVLSLWVRSAFTDDEIFTCTRAFPFLRREMRPVGTAGSHITSLLGAVNK